MLENYETNQSERASNEASKKLGIEVICGKGKPSMVRVGMSLTHVVTGDDVGSKNALGSIACERRSHKQIGVDSELRKKNQGSPQCRFRC